MIYSVGYARLTPVRLFEIAQQLKAVIIDCRYKPYSSIPGFDRPMLADLFGARYEWRGDHLGGFGHTTSEGIALIRNTQHNLLLMCAEEAPGECHRHSDICAPYFPSALHIYRNEMIAAVELERALRSNSPYAISAWLSEYRVP
ncbi:MAG: hypothetical protein ABSB50_03255 [Terracidiphilus sp.]|jgi:hypothetical protein